MRCRDLPKAEFFPIAERLGRTLGFGCMGKMQLWLIPSLIQLDYLTFFRSFHDSHGKQICKYIMILAQFAQTKKCNYHCSDNTNMYCNFVFIVLKKYLDIFLYLTSFHSRQISVNKLIKTHNILNY